MTIRSIVFGSTILLLASCGDRTAVEPSNNEQQPAVTDASTDLRSKSAADASVFFISPSDGDTVSSPVSVIFGISGMDVVPAGTNQPDSGHHHLLIDTDLPDLGLPIPADENHVHFGDGSTETSITLPPGEHTLQMLLGDHLHIPHDPALISAQITVTVE